MHKPCPSISALYRHVGTIPPRRSHGADRLPATLLSVPLGHQPPCHPGPAGDDRLGAPFSPSAARRGLPAARPTTVWDAHGAGLPLCATGSIANCHRLEYLVVFAG